MIPSCKRCPVEYHQLMFNGCPLEKVETLIHVSWGSAVIGCKLHLDTAYLEQISQK